MAENLSKDSGHAEKGNSRTNPPVSHKSPDGVCQFHRPLEIVDWQESAFNNNNTEQYLHDATHRQQDAWRLGVTNGWIDYSNNLVLMKLFSHALVTTGKGHEIALAELKKDIEEQKQHSTLK